jgi:ADP-heptose:LPS heptosyltransferase
MLGLSSPSQSPWPLAQLGRLAGIGLRAVHSAEFGGAAATHWVSPPPRRTHQVDRGLHLLAALGLPGAGGPALRIPADAAARAAALPGTDRFALLVPGASCASRRYPAGRFGTAAARIAAAGIPVRVCGTAAEAGLVAEVAAAAGHPDVRVLPAVPVPEFAALVAALSGPRSWSPTVAPNG